MAGSQRQVGKKNCAPSAIAKQRSINTRHSSSQRPGSLLFCLQADATSPDSNEGDHQATGGICCPQKGRECRRHQADNVQLEVKKSLSKRDWIAYGSHLEITLNQQFLNWENMSSKVVYVNKSSFISHNWSSRHTWVQMSLLSSSRLALFWWSTAQCLKPMYAQLLSKSKHRQARTTWGCPHEIVSQLTRHTWPGVSVRGVVYGAYLGVKCRRKTSIYFVSKCLKMDPGHCKMLKTKSA